MIIDKYYINKILNWLVSRRHKIDLDTLMDLDEKNLMEMNIEIGPRKKILRHIAERKASMQEETTIQDSRM